MRILSYSVRVPVEETWCPRCSAPVVAGDRAYVLVDEDEGEVAGGFCSFACAREVRDAAV